MGVGRETLDLPIVRGWKLVLQFKLRLAFLRASSGATLNGMYLSGRLRIRSALAVLFGLLFMQLAVAGYVCPLEARQAAGGAAPAVQDAQAGHDSMPGCSDASDQDLASAAPLCHTHCQVENQSLDRHELPTFQAALPDPVLAIVVLTTSGQGVEEVFLQPASMTRVTSPPISIRNCCFRT